MIAKGTSCRSLSAIINALMYAGSCNVLLSKMVIVTEPSKEVKTDKNTINRFHSIETHNDRIDRHKNCPYCNNGSKPVPKAQIKGMI